MMIRKSALLRPSLELAMPNIQFKEEYLEAWEVLLRPPPTSTVKHVLTPLP
jgi:hypothetical protein